MTITFKYGENVYTVSDSVSGKLAIQKNTENVKFYKVKPDSEFTYRIQKTQIKAAGGAPGLLRHFKDCIDHNFAVKAWTVTPLENILANVKPAK